MRTEGRCPTCGRSWRVATAEAVARDLGVPLRTLLRWLATSPPPGARRTPWAGQGRWVLTARAVEALRLRARRRPRAAEHVARQPEDAL